MKTTSLLALFCGLSVLVVFSARADSWSPPSEFDSPSENGHYIAHVIPASSTNSKPIVVVSSINNHRTNEIWRTSLSNHNSPVEVRVWDEGTSFVTLDNWAGKGYGPDVVAIYGPEGQRAKYSLEEFAPLPRPEVSPALEFSLLKGYRKKFLHSTSSRHWRSYSIDFFCREADQVLFCLWLDWDNRWVAWRMSDGKLMQVTPHQAKAFSTEGRRRALQLASNKDAPSAALNFLGRLRRPEDRPLIEAWLQDKEFSTGSMTTYSSEKSKPSFIFTAYSYKRQEAENILSRWDGLATNIAFMGTLENYHYLGTVKGQVSLGAAPKKRDGTLRLYLIPTAVPLEKWSESKPEHYLIADLNHNFPTIFKRDKIKDFPLTQKIDFVFYGVTPGNYRIKAVWNKTKPLSSPETIICIPHSGDYESASSSLIAIKRGKEIDGVHIECSSSAGKRRGGR